MGAMGKSAQFLLHTWLPDAMEGPTPVSALIHAATMVTAGVFMVARLSPLFELAPKAQAVVTLVGATTAFFAATVGLVQNDIKRVVAYSTCSQLGYMFVAHGRRRLFGRHVPPVHPRVLQGAAVPRLRLGDPRDASRAGHAPHGRTARQAAGDLRLHAGRHARAHRLPAHRRLLLQGRDHRGGCRGAQSVRRLCVRHDGRRGAAHLVLLVAAHVHDLPRRAGRQAGARARAREPVGDPDPADLPRGRLDPCRRSRSRSCSPASTSPSSSASSLKFGPDNHILHDMHELHWSIPYVADRHDGDRLPRRVAVLHPPARPPEEPRRAARAAVPVPAQQVVLRRDLRLPLRAADALARPRAVEGRRRRA